MPHSFSTALVLSLLWGLAWKSLTLLACAGVACVLLRRASAASRHAVLLLALAGLLLLPVFGLLLPQWSAQILPAARHSQVAALVAPAMSVPVPMPPIAAPDTVSPAPVMNASSASTPTFPDTSAPIAATAVPKPLPIRMTVADWVILAWLAGGLLVLGRTLLGLVAAGRLVRACRPVTEGPLMDVATHARQTLGLTRPIAVRIGAVAVPMTCGLFRPVILLPDNADTWPAERLRAVLLHEIAHIRRGDWATTLLAQCVCALYWPNPLVWLAAHRLRVEAEAASDDIVVNNGISAPDYAAHLLDIVQGLAARRSPLSGTVAMASRPEVAGRLRMILDAHKSRRAVSRRGLAGGIVAAILLIAPLAALRPVASASAASSQRSAPLPLTSLSDRALTAPVADYTWEALFAGTRLNPLMAEKSPWEATLPDGSRVRLLSLGAQDASSSVVSCHGPDGHWQWTAKSGVPLKPVPGRYEVGVGVSVPAGLQKGIGEIAFGTPANPYPPSYGFPPLGGQSQDFWLPATFAAKQTRGAIKVHLAVGPTTTLISSVPKLGANRRLPTGETVSISPVRNEIWREGARARRDHVSTVVITVPKRFVSNFLNYQFEVIAPDGKPSQRQHGFGGGIPHISGGTAHISYDCRTDLYPLDPARVKEFRFTYRPTYTAVFRNIVLSPAVTIMPVSSKAHAENVQKSAMLSAASMETTADTKLTAVSFKVDLTHESGALVQGTGSGARMQMFGKKAAYDLLNGPTTKITSTAPNVWRLADSQGDTATLTDNAPHPIVVINRTQNPMKVVSRAAHPAVSVTVPAHSLAFLNGFRGPLIVTGFAGPTAHYAGGSFAVKVPKTDAPLTIIRSVAPQQSITAYGNETTDTDFDM